MRKWIGLALLALCLLCPVFGTETAHAADQGLDGSVTLLKQEKDYLLQVEVQNTGTDFEGVVRLVFTGTTSDTGTAFEQAIVLPKNGKKQYTLTVPASDMSQTRGDGILAFYEKNGTCRQTVAFDSVLGSAEYGMQVGILSDHADQLSWLDMQGETFYKNGQDLPIVLTALEAEGLSEQLLAFSVLVIDDFDTSVLTDEDVQAITDWTDAGGWLLIGTGARAADTLGAFDSAFTAVTWADASDTGSVLQQRMEQQGYYYGFSSGSIDFKKLTAAALTAADVSAVECDIYPGYIRTYGSGVVGVCAVSLGDEEITDKAVGSMLASSLYDILNSYAGDSGMTDVGTYGWSGIQAFSTIDQALTSLDFTWLRVLIVIYVLLVGPVLYLLLRARKKQDWYWLSVPALGVLFLGAVFLFGRGLNLHTARVYSVTAQRADGKSTQTDAQFCAYNSGTNAWSLQLKDAFSYAGTGFSYSYGSGSSAANANTYHYQVRYDDGLWIGAKPTSNFENQYLYAGGSMESPGAITTEDLVLTVGEQSGTVTNGTDYDLSYVVLYSDEYVLVLDKLPAGQTVSLADADCLAGVATTYFDDVYTLLAGGGYAVLTSTYGTSYAGNVEFERPELAAALFVGLSQAVSQNDVTDSVVVAGIVDDYAKTVQSSCEESAFGCLYTVVGEEAEHAAD